MSYPKILGPTILTPEFHSHGWGYERWIDNNEKYCGKLLVFAAGRRCSLHYHKIKEETFLLHKGLMRVYYHDDVAGIERYLASKAVPGQNIYDILECDQLHQGSVFKVPPGRLHQMIAIEDCELIEFSTQHFDSDSYRLIKGD